ncbi:MAG TPA: alpha/beta hydrolase [Ilumatobacteraceae bacterium]|nr:alpha/beta hydrolase [Ilumatobacteraceae bacterium]
MTPAEAADLFRRAPEHFIDVGAGEVAHRRVGTGPDVLFVHGWPVSGATFRTLLPHLVDHVTCHLIDLPGAGDSRFTNATNITVDQHISSIRRVIDHLTSEHAAGQAVDSLTDGLTVVGHDSGGLFARHAVAGDPRVRAVGLINTEPPRTGWRFRAFISVRHLPGLQPGLAWVAGQPRVRRIGYVLGDAFADSSLLDGEFDEFFLRPLHESPERCEAAVRLLRSFDLQLVRDLPEIHRRITVPVGMVWGDQDPFFPLRFAREMVGTFADARLDVVPGAGLFSHEERPAQVAAALLALVERRAT